MTKPLEPISIQSRFGFHKATIEGPDASKTKHAQLRSSFMSFASYLNENIPAGREASLVFTALEEASMWSHKALAALDPLEDESANFKILETVEYLQARAASEPELAEKLKDLGLYE
jgi:hypothetical protein